MAITTLELMVFYYPNAAGRDDVTYARELMAGAEQIFAPYDIRLNIWPPDRGPWRETVVDRVASDSWCNDHPYMDADVDTKEIVDGITNKYETSLAKRLLVVFGRFGKAAIGSPALGAQKFPDGNGRPKTRLKAFVFVDPQYASIYKKDQRSTLAHEIGHAAELEHAADRTNVMYGLGQARALHPTLYDIQVIMLKSAFFAR
jgi:hypothetical protein